MPELRSALVQPSRVVRQEAAQVLARLPGDHVSLFLEPLAHPDKAIAVEALVHLGKLRRRETAEAVVQRMRSGREEEVLYEGCLTLGKIGDIRCVPELARYLTARKLALFGKRHAERIRYAAACALSSARPATDRPSSARSCRRRFSRPRPSGEARRARSVSVSRPAHAPPGMHANGRRIGFSREAAGAGGQAFFTTTDSIAFAMSSQRSIAVSTSS
jgi:HEAT repeat protein